MVSYIHTCDKCNASFEVEVSSYKEYEKIISNFEKSKHGSAQVKCQIDGCDGFAPRDYTKENVGLIVKGGYKYSTLKYRASAEEAWVKEEIQNTKKVLKEGGGSQHRPYSGYVLKNPEKAGFKKVTENVAKQKAEAAKKVLGDNIAKIEKARKK